MNWLHWLNFCNCWNCEIENKNTKVVFDFVRSKNKKKKGTGQQWPSVDHGILAGLDVGKILLQMHGYKITWTQKFHGHKSTSVDIDLIPTFVIVTAFYIFCFKPVSIRLYKYKQAINLGMWAYAQIPLIGNLAIFPHAQIYYDHRLDWYLSRQH